MSSYGTQRLEELVKRLNLATARGDLEWQPTDNETAFVCTFDGPSVELISKDKDGAAPFILQVLNDKGNVIESITDRGDDPWADYNLAELYERARRSATNVDDILDSILKDLPSIPPPPPQEPEPEPSGYSDEPPF